jgi:hypothetical protein
VGEGGRECDESGFGFVLFVRFVLDLLHFQVVHCTTFLAGSPDGSVLNHCLEDAGRILCIQQFLLFPIRSLLVGLLDCLVDFCNDLADGSAIPVKMAQQHFLFFLTCLDLGSGASLAGLPGLHGESGVKEVQALLLGRIGEHALEHDQRLRRALGATVETAQLCFRRLESFLQGCHLFLKFLLLLFRRLGRPPDIRKELSDEFLLCRVHLDLLCHGIPCLSCVYG